MPYIKADLRGWFAADLERMLDRILTEESDTARSGILNYIISSLLWRYMEESGGTTYDRLNTLVGVLECAKLELYRRIAAPYEDKKIEENGDV